MAQPSQGANEGAPDLRVVFYEEELSHGGYRTASAGYTAISLPSAAVREFLARTLA